ncbi:MAG TPA: ABC transporter permease [Candidatus Acidoferrales bacterium]|nr:ABC transporter permease [Candidatus Acidoferrales bacterium]
MNSVLRDIRYALRGMRRTPLLACAMVVTLAVGIGLNSGAFALLDAFLFRPPTDKDPATFVSVLANYTGWYRTQELFQGFTALDFLAIRNRSRSLTNIAAWHTDQATLGNDPNKIDVKLVTCNYFPLYGLQTPELGRLFRPEECGTPGAAPVALLGDSFWHNHYGADPRIVGRSIRLNQQPYTVVGVIPQDFSLLDESGPGIWVPYTMQPDFWHGHNAFKRSDWYGWAWLNIEGRLKPGYSRADAQAELNVIVQQQDHLYPGSEENSSYSGRRTTVLLTNGAFIENPRIRPLAMLLTGVVMGPLLLVLLIACANVTMLLLSRGAARRKEIGVRLALGAARSRLLRMLATEGAIVALASGALGIWLAIAFPTIMRSFIPDFRADVKPNWAIFAFLAAVTFMAGCIAGLAPATESVKVDLVTTLKQQQGTSPARSRMRAVLLISQVGMSFVLLTGAVLFMRLQHKIASADPGFETAHVFLVPASFLGPSAGTNTVREQYDRVAFYTELARRVRALPGVKSIAYAQELPFLRSDTEEVRVPGETKGQGRQASVDQVSANFFETLGIPIVRGRPFRDSDVTSETKPPADPAVFNRESVASIGIVSQAFARTFWPGQNPVGKTVEWGEGGARVQIVGVARDTKAEGFGQTDDPRLYTLMKWDFGGPLLVRFEGEPGSLAPAIEEAVRTLDSQQLVVPQTLRSLLQQGATDTKSLTEMATSVAAIAVVLAIIGIYGVVAFSTSQRIREFGIRMVLGASKRRIALSVLLLGAKQIAIGLLIGVVLALPASLALTKLFSRMPFKVNMFDFASYAIAAVMLFAVALAAMYLPARRAAKVDPMVALRYE